MQRSHDIHLPIDTNKTASFAFDNAYFDFERLIVPSLVKLIYFLGAALITVVPAIVGITGAFGRIDLSPPAALFGILFSTITGHLLWRTFCEMVIVGFRIYECLYSSQQSLHELTLIAHRASTRAGSAHPRENAKSSQPGKEKRCWQCGRPHTADARFCMKCGTQVDY